MFTSKNKYVSVFWCERATVDGLFFSFFTRESNVMDYGHVFWPEVMV